MRKENCFLSATQILKLANKNSNKRKYILDIIKKQTKIKVLSPILGIQPNNS